MTARSAFDGDTRSMLCESMQRFAREEDATKSAQHAWRSVAAQGWLGLGLPQSAGGYGEFIGDLGLLLSVAGAARWRLPLVECLGEACGALLAAPPTRERDELLGKIASGEAIVLMAGATGDLCTHLLVEERNEADGERGLYLIESSASTAPRRIADASAIDAGRRRAQLLAACESLAIAQAVLDATRQHLAGRKQFGQPILRFQAVQHRLVAIYLRIRELRALLAAAQAAYDDGDGKLDRLLWQLQAQASATAISATQEGIQLHGGMGMTAEMPLGDYYKRVLQLQSRFGSYEFALERLADTLDFQQEVA